jgi:hypothetical protein
VIVLTDRIGCQFHSTFIDFKSNLTNYTDKTIWNVTKWQSVNLSNVSTMSWVSDGLKRIDRVIYLANSWLKANH